MIVDLFAGAGGWSEGLRLIGLSAHVVAALTGRELEQAA